MTVKRKCIAWLVKRPTWKTDSRRVAATSEYLHNRFTSESSWRQWKKGYKKMSENLFMIQYICPIDSIMFRKFVLLKLRDVKPYVYSDNLRRAFTTYLPPPLLHTHVLEFFNSVPQHKGKKCWGVIFCTKLSSHKSIFRYTMFYFFVSGGSSTREKFTLNRANGILSLNTLITDNDNLFTLTIVARDDGSCCGNVNTRETQATIKVQVKQKSLMYR